jgi:hypothetical protein
MRRSDLFDPAVVFLFIVAILICLFLIGALL